jgi:hypothetical protein
MASPARSKSSGRTSQSGRTAKAGSVSGVKSEKPALNLRRTLFSLVLWGLGIFNVVLIASFVQRHIATGNEHAISSDAEVITRTAEALKIEVLNGCGVPGVAQKVADFLRAQGFDPVNVTNLTDAFGRDRFDIPRTMILDRLSNERIYGRKAAQALRLSDDYVEYQKSDRMVAVSVIIGQDYKSIQLAKN